MSVFKQTFKPKFYLKIKSLKHTYINRLSSKLVSSVIIAVKYRTTIHIHVFQNCVVQTLIKFQQ